MGESKSGIPATVKRAGWVIATGPSEPETYWSRELDGFVMDAMEATWLPSRKSADWWIDYKGFGRVAFAKHVAELEVHA